MLPKPMTSLGALCVLVAICGVCKGIDLNEDNDGMDPNWEVERENPSDDKDGPDADDSGLFDAPTLPDDDNHGSVPSEPKEKDVQEFKPFLPLFLFLHPEPPMFVGLSCEVCMRVVQDTNRLNRYEQGLDWYHLRAVCYENPACPFLKPGELDRLLAAQHKHVKPLAVCQDVSVCKVTPTLPPLASWMLPDSPILQTQ